MRTIPRDHGAIVVVGLGYGDESKGATVDYLAATIPDTVAVVRWSGGAQAAHNVRHGARHHTFSQFGSGTLLDVRTILRAPMLVNPILLAAEATLLDDLGVTDPLGLVTVDSRCLVTTPIHAAMNRARERRRGRAPHGSTGLGIGETVAYDLAVRQRANAGDAVGNFVVPSDARVPALTIGMLRERSVTLAALDALARFAAPMLDGCDDVDAHHESVQRIAAELCSVAEHLKIVDDIDSCLSGALGQGTVIFEGSQGVLLDEWHGFHPYTTWSTITPRNLVRELTFAGNDPYVLGLTRTYSTRHGAGPMPTEDSNLCFAEPDNREGTYQGAWRIGHLDLPALRYAAAVSGRIDGVGVSHLDMIRTAENEGRAIMIASGWGGASHPLIFRDTHDLARLDVLTETAFAAAPELERAPADSDYFMGVIARAVNAPVVLAAEGAGRVDRNMVAVGRSMV